LTLPTDISRLQALVETLLAQVASLERQVQCLQAENQALKAENAQFREQLAQNSHNSHLPPSSDRFSAKPAFATQKGGKRGGQEGHPGQTLEMSLHPDEVILLPPPSHCPCGAELSPSGSYLLARRQLMDLPPTQLRVVEYQQYACHCPRCGRQAQTDFPARLPARVQYGDGVKSLLSLLSVHYHLSYGQIRDLFHQLFGQPINAATMVSANQHLYEALAASEAAIQERLLQAAVVHFDETGLAAQGKTCWLHTASTPLFTYLFVHAQRGLAALQSRACLLKDFTGWAVHDCWRAYFAFSQCQHALCGAHLLRELQALIEQGSHWATQMHALLLKLYHKSDQGKGQVAEINLYLIEYAQICALAQAEEPAAQPAKSGKAKASKGRNLLERLIKHQASVLAFASYAGIPFTNNQAERDIRPAKTKLKNAGCFRTLTGANHYARIQSFISTARKQGKNVLQELQNACLGFTFLTQAKLPS
jgi:transposase